MASHRAKSSLSLQDQIRQAGKECYQETTKDSPSDYLLFAAKHAAANGLSELGKKWLAGTKYYHVGH